MLTNPALSVLQILIRNPEIFKSERGILPPVFFKDLDFRSIYECSKDYLSEYGTSPSYDILLEILVRKYPRRDKLSFASVLSPIFAEPDEPLDPKHIRFMIQKMEEAWRVGTLRDRMSSAISSLENQNSEEAFRIWREEITAPVNSRKVAELTSGLDSYLERSRDMKAHPEKYPFIHLGFETMDRATGGLGRGELAVIIGGTGVGKSLVLGQMALNAAKAGRRVLLVTVENDLRSYQGRLYSNLSAIDYWRLKRGDLNREDGEALMSAIADLPDNFELQIVEFPEGCCARDIAEYMQEQDPFDFVVADQITNMFPNQSKGLVPMSWQFFSQISLDLKRLAGYAYDGRGVALASASQAAGGINGKSALTTDDIAMAKAISHHAHAVIFITRDEDKGYMMGASKWRDAYVPLFPIFPHFPTWSVSENAHPGIRGRGHSAGISSPLASPQIVTPLDVEVSSEIITFDNIDFPSLDLDKYPEPENENPSTAPLAEEPNTGPQPEKGNVEKSPALEPKNTYLGETDL